MVCRFLYDGRTCVLFIICENFNKTECCTKISGQMSVWNCRKKLVLWCSCETKVVIVFYWKMCLEELGFKCDCVLEY